MDNTSIDIFIRELKMSASLCAGYPDNCRPLQPNADIAGIGVINYKYDERRVWLINVLGLYLAHGVCINDPRSSCIASDLLHPNSTETCHRLPNRAPPDIGRESAFVAERLDHRDKFVNSQTYQLYA